MLVISGRDGSPAAKAGLKPGDVVLKLDGNRVNNSKSLQDAVEKLEIGKGYELEILRGGEKDTLSVTIEQIKRAAEAARGRIREFLAASSAAEPEPDSAFQPRVPQLSRVA